MNKISGITTIAIDLVDTLVKRGKQEFITSVINLFKQEGINIDFNYFYEVYRKRYLEYSMGNYLDDISFFKTVFFEFPEIDVNFFAPKIMDITFSSSPPFFDSEEFLNKAHSKYKLILSSNYVYSWAREIINRNKWYKYFYEIIISSNCRYRKPSYEFFQLLIKRSKIKTKSEMLLVGDSITNDIFGSINVGLKVIWLNRQNKPQIFSDKITEISSLKEISKIIEI